MTHDEKLNYMRIMGEISENESDELLTAYLNLAEQKLINHIYPYRNDVVALERKYEMKQIELAIILYSKRGAEGEEHHNENGVNRRYESEDKFLASIPRHVGIPK